MITDPIADLLTRIRNAQKANHEELSIRYSKMKENILRVLKTYHFVTDYKIESEGNKKDLLIKLNEERRDLVLKRISKPGQRIYIGENVLKRVRSGLGIQILSTSKGVMSNIEAKKENVGGELLCEIY